VAMGRFDYDRRGILDRGHMRFFTQRSFERLASDQDLAVQRRAPVGMPFEVVDRGREDDGSGSPRTAGDVLRPVDSMTVALRPTLFAYQFVYELRPATEPTIELRDTDAPPSDAEPLAARPG
jgi:hypothetical protein